MRRSSRRSGLPSHRETIGAIGPTAEVISRLRSPSISPHEWSPQDWWLVANALIQLVDDPCECTTWEDRAYELIEGIAVQQGLDPGLLIRQLD